MKTFSALLAIWAGNSPVPVSSPHKGQWGGALMFSLICAQINGWVNNREAGDLRRHRAHYDCTVMIFHAVGVFSLQLLYSISVCITFNNINGRVCYHNYWSHVIIHCLSVEFWIKLIQKGRGWYILERLRLFHLELIFSTRAPFTNND